jgi:transcriptional regulator with GAF, ATPase, and Fis domain/tetratricopeptide (TPR) repeat protein
MEVFAGRFTLLRSLGRGGMGNVWLAVDHTSGAECALKRLESDLPVSERDSLRREFEVLSRVRHPSIVSAYELGFAPDGTLFYTMEYVPGVAADVALGPGDWTLLYSCAAQLAHALEVLHAAGVVHGDVKPSNLLVVLDPRVKGHADVRLLDLGLAALLGRDRRGHRGTPGFAAPEVVGGAPSSIASDLYGFGATLYVLALRCAAPAAWAPGKGPGPPHARTDVALALEEAAVPEPLARLLLGLLAADATARPADAREVRQELERLHPAAKRSLAERLENAVMVGRQHELARLERWLAIAPKGPAMLLLSGEPGTGRSAMLTALAARASLAGHPIVILSPRGSAPGSAVRTLLRRLAVEGHAEHAGDLGSAALLARLADSAPLGAEIAAHEETVMGWAATVHRARGALLVCIDDADQLDPVSQANLRRLALHPQSGVLRWIWSVPSSSGRVSGEQVLLLDSGQAEHLALRPLDRASTEALVRARLHAPPPPELMEALWERAGGHPGLVVETLRAAVSTGAIADTEAGIALDRERLSQLPRSRDLEQASLARLRALGPEVVATATALAVCAAAISEEELARLEPRAGAASLAVLERAGLLVRDEDGRASLHPAGFARAVLQSLDPGTRESLHRAMLALDGLLPAQRFRYLAGAGDVASALAVAEQAFAGDLALTLEAAHVAGTEAEAIAALWAERAGRALLDRGRYREAIPYVERALELEPTGEARGRRWHLLSGALLRTGARERLAELHATALASPLADRERALLLANEGMRRGLAGDKTGAEVSAVEALALAARSGDGEAESIAALTLGTMRRLQGRLDETMRLAEQAEAAATRSGYALGRLRGAGLRALCAAMRRDTAEAEQIYRNSLAEARQRGARLAEHELGINLAWVLVEAGRWAEAREVEEEVLRVALQEGWPAAVSQVLTNLAMFSALTGRVAGCIDRARAARRMVRQHQPLMEAYAWRTLATALRVTGRARRGLRVARRALVLAEGQKSDSDLAWCQYEYGRACAVRGRWAEAGAVWERGVAESGAEELARPILATASGRAALRAGALQVAADHLASAEAWLEGRSALYVKAHVDQLRAELSLARGEVETGARQADVALRSFGDLPAPPDAASAAIEFARVANRAGIAARTPVPDWLRTAAEGFERLGDHRQRERALALAVDWHRRHGSGAPGPARDRDLLESVTRLLDSQPGLDELSRRAMQLAVDQLDAERGVLVLVDESTGEPHPMVEHGAVDARTRDKALTYSREIVGRVARSGGSLLVGDLTTDPESLSHSMLELGLRSVLCVPMFGAGRVVGAVYLDDSRRAQAFGDAERGLLEGFAHLLAVAIENSRGHEQVRRANEQLVGENLSLRREVSKRFQPQNFIGASSAMQRVLALVERAAEVPATVLITGENGTGKELIARLLHYSGPRKMLPFVAVNCGAIAPTLLESELFGILADVATGVRARSGRFVEAHGGTLFLDEIGDMPPAQQVALLSVLANRKVTPVGGGRALDVDVRVIAATNRDLVQKIADGSFREDLWYRLNVVPIEMPPLRERKADIPALALHFAAVFAGQQGREVPELSPTLLAVLMQSDWPGNVRELQNYIERLMAMTAGRVLHPKPLPHDLERRARGRLPHLDRDRPLGDQVAELERRQVLGALERNLGNQSRAARELGLTEQSLRYRLRKYAINKGRRFRRTR